MGSITLSEADNPILNITLPTSAVNPGAEITLGGSGYESTDKVSLKTESADAIEITEVTVDGNGLTFTLPSDCEAGSYTVTLIRSAASWDLGTLTVELPKRIKSMSVIGYGGQLEYKFEMSYETGELVKMSVASEMSGQPYGSSEYAISYGDNKITATDSEDAENPVILVLENGRVTESTVYSAYESINVTYQWEYTTDGYLATVKDKAYPTLYYSTFTFENGDLTNFVDTSTGKIGYSYEGSSQTVASETLNPGILINGMTLIMYGRSDIFIAYLLNIAGQNSSKIPAQILTSEYDENYNIVDQKYSVTTEYSSDGNELKISSEYSMMNSATIVYEEVK